MRPQATDNMLFLQRRFSGVRSFLLWLLVIVLLHTSALFFYSLQWYRLEDHFGPLAGVIDCYVSTVPGLVFVPIQAASFFMAPSAMTTLTVLAVEAFIGMLVQRHVYYAYPRRT